LTVFASIDLLKMIFLVDPLKTHIQLLLGKVSTPPIADTDAAQPRVGWDVSKLPNQSGSSI